MNDIIAQMSPEKEQAVALIIIAVSFLWSGFIFIAVSVPLLMKRIGPNKLYGFRTKTTINNPEIWYKVNKNGAYIMIGIGVLTIIYNVFLLIFRKQLGHFIPWPNLVILIGGTIVLVIYALIYPRVLLDRQNEKQTIEKLKGMVDEDSFAKEIDDNDNIY